MKQRKKKKKKKKKKRKKKRGDGATKKSDNNSTNTLIINGFGRSYNIYGVVKKSKQKTVSERFCLVSFEYYRLL